MAQKGRNGEACCQDGSTRSSDRGSGSDNDNGSGNGNGNGSGNDSGSGRIAAKETGCDKGGSSPARLLQSQQGCCGSISAFTGSYSLVALMTTTLTAYINSQVTTLERQFGFSSSQTGLILVANDVGFVSLVLFISFLAPKVHLPRALAGFTILFGVSGMACAVPHFLFGAPGTTSSPPLAASNVSALMTSARPSQHLIGQLCDGRNYTSLNCDVTVPENSDQTTAEEDGVRGLSGPTRGHASSALAILVAAMFVQGLAKAPRSPFCTLYVDSSVARVDTGFYLSIIIAAAVVGPALAFAGGAMFSRIYVTLEDSGLHFRHPRWLGAWWLGFLTFGSLSCLLTLPLFCFPRRLQRTRGIPAGDPDLDPDLDLGDLKSQGRNKIDPERKGGQSKTDHDLVDLKSKSHGETEPDLGDLKGKGQDNNNDPDLGDPKREDQSKTDPDLRNLNRKGQGNDDNDPSDLKRKGPSSNGVDSSDLKGKGQNKTDPDPCSFKGTDQRRSNLDPGDLKGEGQHEDDLHLSDLKEKGQHKIDPDLSDLQGEGRLGFDGDSTPTDQSPSALGRLIQLVKDFVRGTGRVWGRPVYGLTVLSVSFVIFAAAGAQSFTAKYMENQFAFPVWKANIAMAGVNLGASCVGSLMGGYLSRRLKLGPLGGLKVSVALYLLSFLFSSLLLLFRCPQPRVFNSPRHLSGAVSGVEGEVVGCVEGCGCDDGGYFPVCGGGGLTYFSPCHAGCASAVDGNYVNCTCIEGGTAVAGLCDYSCAMFYPFVVCCGVVFFFSTMNIIPNLIVYLRVVEERDRALAVGYNAFMNSLGWMLGPITFGKLIDGICIQWEESCATGGGACLLYDNEDFGFKLLGYQALMRGVAWLLTTTAFLLARRANWANRAEEAKTAEQGPTELTTVEVTKITEVKGSEIGHGVKEVAGPL